MTNGLIRRVNLRIILFVLFALLSPTIAQAEAGDIAAVSRSVVRVAVFSEVDGKKQFVGHGSGVVVAPDKIVTNAHVVEEAMYNESMTFLIVPSQGTQNYKAILVDWSPQNDLALLQISDGGRLIPSSLYNGVLSDGGDVFAIGYPANVDIAMDYSEADTLRPQSPIKTRGSISSGRSSKAFDSLLHTAPIAPGNSGGPLVDACGRVIGINSFGSVAENGGAEFYFAVSIRELSAFLRKNKVDFNMVTGECRSVAELTRAEAEREAVARAKIEAENRVASELRAAQEGKTRREAELDIIAARENRIMLSALLLILSLGAAGTSYLAFERGKRQYGIGSATAAAVFVVIALAIFVLRPSFDKVDAIVRAKLTKTEDGNATSPANPPDKAGKKMCVIQLDRSKVTVSNTADVAFDWTDTGCVNGRTQYAQSGEQWTRSFVPNNDAQVSVVSYTPDGQSYRIERYLLGFEAMVKARDARNNFDVKGCSADSASKDKIGNMNNAVREVLPLEPNELLVFKCSGTK